MLGNILLSLVLSGLLDGVAFVVELSGFVLLVWANAMLVKKMSEVCSRVLIVDVFMASPGWGIGVSNVRFALTPMYTSFRVLANDPLLFLESKGSVFSNEV